MNILALILLTISTFSIEALAARTEAEIRESIRGFVSQRHPGPSDAFWKELGPDSVPVIRRMYQESSSNIEKSFLIDGLSRFSDAATGDFLKNAVESSGDEVTRKKLLSAVIRSQGEVAFDFVEPYLKDADPHVRMAVASGLKDFSQNEKVKQRLDRFRKEEKKPWVLAGMDRGQKDIEIQRPRRPESPIPAGNQPSGESNQKSAGLKPLLEKDWAGTWKGQLLSSGNPVAVEASLMIADASAKPLSWKVLLSLPKKVKQEWRSGDFTVHYFMSNLSHWIELRHPKLDAVFIAQKREAK